MAADLQRKGYLGRTIGIKLRWGNFKIVTRDVSLPEATDNAKLIRHTAGLALKRVDLTQRFRLLGVRVSKLEPKDSKKKEQLLPVDTASGAIKKIVNEKEPELF